MVSWLVVSIEDHVLVSHIERSHQNGPEADVSNRHQRSPAWGEIMGAQTGPA